MNQPATSDRTPEFTDQAETTSKRSGLMPWLRDRWNALIYTLSRGHEPRVQRKRTATGDIFYHAYDPCTGQSAYLTSEYDLRSWLEQLRYH